MYNIFKNRISAGGYHLADIQHRIKKLYALGDLTEEQTDELLSMTQQHASADAERPETMLILKSLSDRIEAIEKKLETGETPSEGETGSDTTVEEYEPWKPWDGVSNKYQPGAIVTHNGKLWKSIHTGQNTWEPGTVGTERLWVEYTAE